MPSRNIVKSLATDAYYHVYARGASKQPVFVDEADYAFFIKLFERYLSKMAAVSSTGVGTTEVLQVRPLTDVLL
jgi:hypothetical protein